MKAIATAAVILMLSTPTWAEEPESNEPANTDEPIVLSEAEMDGVTAGVISRTFLIAENNSPLPQDRLIFNYHHFNNVVSDVQ